MIIASNSWVEISERALTQNVKIFKSFLRLEERLMGVVKANAYGHGATVTAPALLRAGVDWLGVFSLAEALELRRGGIAAPVMVLGGWTGGDPAAAADAKLRLTVASPEGAAALAESPASRGVRVHLKVETGTNRQGLDPEEAAGVARTLRDAGIIVEGLYTHFADIEDTTDHEFAKQQLARFAAVRQELGSDIEIAHTACTAAAILFPETYFDMARVGLGLYGLWPSKETRVSAGILDRNGLDLMPALTWKTRIAQVKEVPAGQFVGYGRTFRSTRESRVAVLPMGYADGYDRRLSNGARVIVRGTRAPVVGRVCMNMTMVDVTDIPGARAGDEVILLGTQGDETVSAEDLARLAGTINYEIVTRLAPAAPRVLVKG